MKWYYANGGQQSGPVDEHELRTLVETGVVRDETLVWHEGLTNWQPYSAVRGMPVAGTAPPAFPAVSPAYSGGHPAAFPAAGDASGAQRRYAGFWIRFVARMIDGILLWFVQFLLAFPILLALGVGTAFSRGSGGFAPVFGAAQAITSLIGIAVGLTYEVFFLTTRGGTPGKLILGLRVVTTDGSAITPARAFGRYFAYLLSAFTLMIGFIMAGFDAQKRALHDRLCETRVVRTR